MLSALQSLDEKILFFINGLHASWLDAPMHCFSDRFFWIPFYAVLMGLVIWRFRKKTLIIIPVLAVLVLVSDQSSHFVKERAKRERPCHNANIEANLYVPYGCGGNYGFYSSHASNTFALALFLFLLWKGRPGRKWLLLLFFWAALVSWSRMYLGVHYPFDVLAGALNGLLWAWLISLLARKYIKGWPGGKVPA